MSRLQSHWLSAVKFWVLFSLSLLLGIVCAAGIELSSTSDYATGPAYLILRSIIIGCIVFFPVGGLLVIFNAINRAGRRDNAD